MSSRDYVWEQLLVAVTCLCGEGGFKHRLENATQSALSQLEDDDLFDPSNPQLNQDLRFVLDWTKANCLQGSIQKEPNEQQRAELIGKMINLLNNTFRHE